LYLDNLPVSRVLPLSFVPADDDITIQLIRQELSDGEDEVRSGKTTMGMGYSFYLQLAQVLQRPSSPEPIPQRNLRPDSNPSTDSSYHLPGPTHRKATSASILDPVLEETTHTEPPEMVHADQYTSNTSQDVPHAPRCQDLLRDAEHMGHSGSDWDSFGARMSSGGKSIDSIEEDKLEALSYQMAVTFLSLLAGMEDRCHEERDRKVVFRCFAFLSSTN
jgi:hypothetical protein